MQQRDFVERQIEMMGRFLAGVLSKLAGRDLTSTQEANDVSQDMKAMLGFDVDELLALPEHRFVQTLLDTGNFDTANFEKLADVLFLLAEPGQNLKLYARALMLYQYLEVNDKAYSIERNLKISKIKALNIV